MNGWTNEPTAMFVSRVAGNRILWNMVKEFIKFSPQVTGTMLAEWAEDNLPYTKTFNSLSWSQIDWDQVAEEWQIFK